MKWISLSARDFEYIFEKVIKRFESLVCIVTKFPKPRDLRINEVYGLRLELISAMKIGKNEDVGCVLDG